MAYEPTNWKSGDVVTSAKLNKMEQGIKDAGPLIVNSTLDPELGEIILDKTWQEIYNAFMSGKMCIIIVDDSGNQVRYLIINVSDNTVCTLTMNGSTVRPFVFSANTPDDYPIAEIRA